MPSPTGAKRAPEPDCSIERCLSVLSDSWMFLIIREALMGGVDRFSDFQERLGIAPNVLTDRLAQLVEHGVLTKRVYQEPGSRARRSYHLTSSGKDLAIPLAALQQWGDVHKPRRAGPTMERRTPSASHVRVGFLDDDNNPVPQQDCVFVTTELST